jgi:phosphatidylserine decarboxylase
MVASLLLLAIGFFFRDPERSADALVNAILSPADRRVITTRETGLSELSAGSGYCISIFLSVLDVHVNRAPCDGFADTTPYRAGGHRDA